MITPFPPFLITYFLGSFASSTMWKPNTILILGVNHLLNKLDVEINNWEGNLPAAWPLRLHQREKQVCAFKKHRDKRN
jgi:hypothetical protein